MFFAATTVNLLLILLPEIFCEYNLEEYPIIRIQDGFVQGIRMSENLYGFRGIPYAKPPISELRFEPPQPASYWNGIWNATYDRSGCYRIALDSPSSLIAPQRASGDEDCLYINVYTPQLPNPNVLLPVMVWIYGGAFILGESKYTSNTPDDLVKQGVIVVTFNYRLGIFGFLSTGDEAAPGNIAIKDQILALKWIQDNIKYFGGNPSEVTIFGESAGSASVSYLVISPLTKGLFRGAIMESGTALCTWALSKTAREAAYLVGRSLNIQANDSQILVNELKKISAEQLLLSSSGVMSSILGRNPLYGLVYAPVIEIPNETAVLTESSYQLLLKGVFNRVPIIIGYTSAEAEGFSGLVELLEEYLLMYDQEPSRLVPTNMNAEESNIRKVGEEIQKFYGGEDGRLSSPSSDFKLFMTDDQFVRPIQKTAALMSLYTDVYLYKFSYTTDENSIGAAHGEELDFLFQSDRNTTDDRLMRKCMLQLWTNFAKYNNPTPSKNVCSGNLVWRPARFNKRKGRYYVNIDRKSVLGKNPNWMDITFWDKLYQTYGNPPYETF